MSKCKYCSCFIDASNIGVESGQQTICSDCVNLWQDEKDGIALTPEHLAAHLRALRGVESIEAYIDDPSAHGPSSPSPRRENMEPTNQPNQNAQQPQFQSRLMGDAELTGVQPAVQKKRLIFNALTQAKVIDITFNETEKKPAPRSEDTQIRVNARVQMKLLAPIEGQEEFFTNYGLSIFEKKTGEKTLYWGKTATDAMTLRDLVSDASGIPKEQMDLIKLKNYLVGKTVYCKSENRSNPTDGSTVSKALIKQIKMD